MHNDACKQNHMINKIILPFSAFQCDNNFPNHPPYATEELATPEKKNRINRFIKMLF